jgi:hypothetical protein
VVVDATVPGFAITTNTGGSFRLIWFGNGTYTQFSGTVDVPGSFTTFTPGCAGQVCPIEPGATFTKIIDDGAGGQYFQFDTTATTGPDGVDFATNDPNPQVYFELYVNGVSHPELVNYADTAGVQATVADNPFIIQGTP